MKSRRLFSSQQNIYYCFLFYRDVFDVIGGVAADLTYAMEIQTPNSEPKPLVLANIYLFLNFNSWLVFSCLPLILGQDALLE